MSEIKLFPHNEEAVEDMIDGLSESNFAFMERATGTGKSMILIKLMDELMRNKRVLFVTLHDAMFNQFLKRDMPSCGTSKEDYEALDCILYHSIPKHDANWYYNNYDFFIFDEAQHCGAPKWGEVIGELSELVKVSKDKKMIGATATRTRYLDNYIDVCREYFDNNLVSNLGLPEAILRELLPTPYYINLNHSSEELIKNIRLKIRRVKREENIDLSPLEEEIRKISEGEKEISVNELLKTHQVQPGEKYVVFCSNIDDIEIKKELVKDWFDGIAPVKHYSVHSHQPNSMNQGQINAFEDDNDSEHVKIMFAVDMFNEGLHIRGVDGIIMTRNTSSPILYLQQLGRALSYSARNNQIKVFDLAGNATSIDIIYNLYKELLEIAKDNLEKGKGNTQLYESIMDRFKIVDEGTQVNDRLLEIERFLDDNFINKEKVDRYIDSLCDYSKTINGRFMDLIEEGKIDRYHLKIYKELQLMSELITYAGFIKLSSHNIIVTNIQFNEELLKQIEIKGNYKAIKDEKLNEFMLSYNRFYLKNKRRPNNPEKEEEVTLNQQYRQYLISLGLKDIKRILRTCSYPLNVEELFLIRNYPRLEDINEYLDKIEKKYVEGNPLDPLEIKTLESINRFTSLIERPIIKTILSIDTQELDDAIRVISEYKSHHPKETFSKKKDKRFSSSLIRALEILDQKASRVTNLQFEKLLDLNIKLPKVIDMTMEERLSILGDFQTFHEYWDYTNKRNVKRIVEFIHTNQRKPDPTVEEEKELYDLMQALCADKFKGWYKKIYKALIQNEVPLTLEEKENYSPESLTDKDYKEAFIMTKNSVINLDLNHFDTKATLKRIKLFDEKKRLMLKLSGILKSTTDLIQYIQTANSPDLIRKHLRVRQSYIPYALRDYLKETYGFTFTILEEEASNQGKYINYAHQEYEKQMSSVRAYYRYIEQHHARPDTTSELHQQLRGVFANSSTTDIITIINRINKMKMPITLYEKFLLGLCNEEEEEKLYQFTKKKRSSKKGDALDDKIYFKLHRKKNLDIVDESYIVDDTSEEELNNNINNRIIEKMKKQIDEDPSKEIEYNDSEILKKEFQELEHYRIKKYQIVFMKDVIERMKSTGSSYEDFLSEEELKFLKSTLHGQKMTSEHYGLAKQIAQLEQENTLKKHHINKEEFLSQYTEFLRTRGEIPQVESEDEDESVLAEKMEIIQGTINSDERQAIKRECNKVLTEYRKNKFMNEFSSFVQTTGRFPSIESDDPAERDLARGYHGRRKTLTFEEKKTIEELGREYAPEKYGLK